MIVKTYPNYLSHHGIKGQKWGVRRFQNSDGSLTEAGKKRYSEWYNNDEKMPIKRLKKAKKQNLDKWGSNENNNILYVSGLSGSGKSTVSGYLADKHNAELINLDSYLSPMSNESREFGQNKKFNAYLNKKVPNWKNVIKNDDKLDWKIVDDIAKASESFGKKLYGKNKVIIEGVQLMDNTFYEDKNFYNDKPCIRLTTSFVASTYRGSIRDSDNLIDFLDLVTYRTRMKLKEKK